MGGKNIYIYEANSTMTAGYKNHVRNQSRILTHNMNVQRQPHTASHELDKGPAQHYLLHD